MSLAMVPPPLLLPQPGASAARGGGGGGVRSLSPLRLNHGSLSARAAGPASEPPRRPAAPLSAREPVGFGQRPPPRHMRHKPAKGTRGAVPGDDGSNPIPTNASQNPSVRRALQRHPCMKSAMRKLGDVACMQNPRLDYKVMGALENGWGAKLDKQQLSEYLRRCFNVRLTPGELGALLLWFDRDGDFHISNAEFACKFYGLIEEERKRRALLQRQRDFAFSEREARFKRGVLKRLDPYKDVKVVWPDLDVTSR